MCDYPSEGKAVAEHTHEFVGLEVITVQRRLRADDPASLLVGDPRDRIHEYDVYGPRVSADVTPATDGDPRE